MIVFISAVVLGQVLWNTLFFHIMNDQFIVVLNLNHYSLEFCTFDTSSDFHLVATATKAFNVRVLK